MIPVIWGIFAFVARGACTSTFCPNQICDNSGLVTDEIADKFQSEICTWENVMGFLPSSCWKSQCDDEPWNWKTGFFISSSSIRNDLIENYNYWLLGQCDNIDVLLYTEHVSECTGNIEIESSPSFLLKEAMNETSPDHISHIMSTILRLFFGYTVENSFVDSQVLQWNTLTKYKCKIIRGVIPAHSVMSTNESEVTNATQIYSEFSHSSPTVTVNSSTIQYSNTSNSNLTRHSHHGGGGITESILYIICALCGSGALSLLFCFRRVRHCICTTCGLCRDTHNLLVNDD